MSPGERYGERTLDASTFHGDDVGTLGSGSGWSEKAGIVGRNSHSDNQGAANVEDEYTPEDTANGLDDVAAGAFCLRRSAISAQVSWQVVS